MLLVGCQTTNSNVGLSEEHRDLVAAFVENRRTATAITPIPEGTINEREAYRIADAYVAELMSTEGPVGGYKIGTFEKGLYDEGPVDGWSGPVTAVMFASGLYASGHHVSIDCCNFTFVEADFAAEVGSDAINDAQTDLEILAALKGFRPFIEMPDILTTAPGGSKFSGVATNYDFRTGILGDLVRVPATPVGLDQLNSFNYAMTNEQGEVLGEGSIVDAYEPVLPSASSSRSSTLERSPFESRRYLVAWQHGDDSTVETRRYYVGATTVSRHRRYRDLLWPRSTRSGERGGTHRSLSPTGGEVVR